MQKRINPIRHDFKCRRPELSFWTAAILAMTLIACSTTESGRKHGRTTETPQSLGQKHDQKHDQKHGQTHSQTTVVFIVDGLSVPILKTAIENQSVPNILNYFDVAANQPLRLARASFPTLTYPNMTSILTGMPVADHGIIGNRILDDEGTEINFESPLSWSGLAKTVKGLTVFSELNTQGESSVSYSFPFPFDSTASQHLNLDVALNYAAEDYANVDAETLHSLSGLLKSSRDWPRLIFVHLISVDAVAHAFGPTDIKVQSTLQDLDRELKTIFDSFANHCEETGNEKSLTAVLTADHGFATIENEIPIEPVVHRLNEAHKAHRHLKLVADNRTAGIWVPQGWTRSEMQTAAKSFLHLTHVAMSIAKTDHRLDIFYANGKHGRIELSDSPCDGGTSQAHFVWLKPKDPSPSGFHCPEEFDADAGFGNRSYMVSALVEYFAAAHAPDLLLLPDDTSEFSGEFRGNHGGLSANEIFVPLLTHNTTLRTDVFATWRLFHELGFLPSAK